MNAFKRATAIAALAATTLPGIAQQVQRDEPQTDTTQSASAPEVIRDNSGCHVDQDSCAVAAAIGITEAYPRAGHAFGSGQVTSGAFAGRHLGFQYAIDQDGRILNTSPPYFLDTARGNRNYEHDRAKVAKTEQRARDEEYSYGQVPGTVYEAGYGPEIIIENRPICRPYFPYGYPYGFGGAFGVGLGVGVILGRGFHGGGYHGGSYREPGLREPYRGPVIHGGYPGRGALGGEFHGAGRLPGELPHPVGGPVHPVGSLPRGGGGGFFHGGNAGGVFHGGGGGFHGGGGGFHR